MSILSVLAVALFAAFGVSRLFFRSRPDLGMLLAPALLIVAWTFVIAACVQSQIPLSRLWAPLWVATTFMTIAGAIFAFRDREHLDWQILAVPTIASALVMAPYFLHGFAKFPGSWLWDGFAYVAAGESLWLYPRRAIIPDLELFYQFGHRVAQTRYVSSSFLALLKGTLPFGGDAQAATGYFLYLCVFTFASSCLFLARAVIPGRSIVRIAFVVVATVSGPVLNLLWANNFDHLLAMSVAPAVIGLAFLLRWDRAGDAILLGLSVASLSVIYPEMAALFVMPPALILLTRLVREARSVGQAKSIAIAMATTALLLAPIWPDLWTFLQGQLDAVAHAAAPTKRPGDGYFPSFFSTVCAPAAGIGMFPPFLECQGHVSQYAKAILGIACWATLVLAVASWRRNVALLISAAIIVAVAAFFLVSEHYDYGAFKVMETGWVPIVLLGFLGAVGARRGARYVAGSLAAMLVVASVVRVVSFDRWVDVKSIDRFAALEARIPPASVIDVKIDDPLAFQWATYYLRNRRANFIKGELPYFPRGDAENAFNRPADYVVSDAKDFSAIWSNGTYSIFPVK